MSLPNHLEDGIDDIEDYKDWKAMTIFHFRRLTDHPTTGQAD